MTTVRAGRYVACPFSASIEYAEHAMREHTEVVLSPAPAVGEHAGVESKVSEDFTDPARRHDALLLAWHPRHAFFPHFRGALTVRPRMRGSYMRLQGSYEPPAGAVGRAFDALAGRFIAVLTLRHLLGEIASAVEREWNEFRKELQP